MLKPWGAAMIKIKKMGMPRASMAAREAAAATAGSGNGSVEHWRRSKRAGVETIGARERVILLRHLVGCGKGPLARVGHLDERGAAPTGLELLGRGAYVPRFLSPNPPFYVRRHGYATVDLEPISSSA